MHQSSTLSVGMDVHHESIAVASVAQAVADSWRRTAADVVKILKGAKSADLPVEQVTKLDLIINLRTAQVPGLTLPPSLLFQADVVIQ